VRRSLIDALVSCAETPLKSKAYEFLTGLSSDELQFIAGFLGACTLGFAGRLSLPLAARSEDMELKLIVLREYLAQSGLKQLSVALG
jgi:hypothetical protein